MKDEPDWREEIAAFDANRANEESRIMWLRIGLACQEWAVGGLDCLEELEYADRAMAYAARAEACFSRATGDDEAITPDVFIPELAASKEQDNE